MRYLHLSLCLGFLLSVTLLTGCGRDSTAKPVGDQDEIAAYLAENPDADTNVGEDEMELEEE
jgi:hypothetical protein